MNWRAVCGESVRHVVRHCELFEDRTRVLGNTLRATPYLKPKGGGDKSLVVKRRMIEGCYVIALQALRNMVKPKLVEF